MLHKLNYKEVVQLFKFLKYYILLLQMSYCILHIDVQFFMWEKLTQVIIDSGVNQSYSTLVTCKHSQIYVHAVMHKVPRTSLYHIW